MAESSSRRLIGELEKPPSLAEQAYARIEELIVTLALPPGAVFSEQQLASQIGIGRTPLREALQRLAQQQLVVMLPRRGVLVSEIHVGQMMALLETRRVLDRLIASRAARRASDQQRARMRLLAEEMLACASARDLEAYLRVDRAFDSLMEQACRNPFAARAAAPLHTHCRRFWYYYGNLADLPNAAEKHHAIMEAVAAGMEKEAEEASDRLLDDLVQLARKALDVQ